MSPLRTPTSADAVGLAAPASAPVDPDALRRGAARLTDAGFRLADPLPALSPVGYLAGTDDERSARLNALLGRPDVPVVVAVRGGYGCLRLLDRIDFEAARRHPTLVVGYSDITALHMALWARAGLPSLSGAMAAVEWAAGTGPWTRPWLDVVGGRTLDDLTLPGTARMTALKPGVAEGPLAGGNLSVFCRLVGTPYLPDLAGSILFFEDVDEPPYRIDGMLAQLRHAGILEAAAGLVFGRFDFDPPDRPSLALEDVLDTYAESVNGPVATGLAYGHVPDKVPLPIGIRARLDATHDTARLGMLEPLTVPNA